MMIHRYAATLVVGFFLLLALCLPLRANKMPHQMTPFSSTEAHFQDMFVTAGYSTAFGAALGAACIGLSPNPEEHLNYIAIGASIGFISGSLLGSYIVIAPSFASSTSGANIKTQLAQEEPSSSRTSFHLQPMIQDGHRTLGLGVKHNF